MAVGDLVLAGDLGHFGIVRLPRCSISLIVVAQRSIVPGGHPEREAASTGLRIDVGSGTDDQIHAQLLCELIDRGDISRLSREVDRLVVGSMIGPAGVKRKRSKSGGLDFLDNVSPEPGDGNAPVVELAGEDEDALTMNVETVVIPLDDRIQVIVVERPFGVSLVLSCAEQSQARKEKKHKLGEARHGAGIGQLRESNGGWNSFWSTAINLYRSRASCPAAQERSAYYGEAKGLA